MKKFLLFILSITVFFQSKAQTSACGVSNLTAQITNRTSTSTCSVNSITFNLDFDGTFNGGAKFVNLIIWQAKNYPSFSYTNASSIPSPSYLTSTNAFGVIVLKDGVPQATYQGSSTNVLFPLNVLVTEPTPGTFHYRITGITKTFSQCPVTPTEQFSIKADVWASNGGSNNSVHCATAGLTLNLDDPIINTNFYCSATSGPQRQYDVTFINNGISTLNITYETYVDANGNGNFDGASGGDILVTPTVTVPTLDPSETEYSGRVDYFTYSNTSPYRNQSLFIISHIQVVGPGYNYTYDRTVLLENGCSPLPVSFKAFNAARNQSKVALNWITSSESNNRGFNVQRNTKGVWETIAFVFSAADGGNSSSDLSYSYNDANSNKGVSQYRIQQVDLDGKARYSEVRSVRGEEMSSRLLVFPNPSNSGNVSLVFQDQSMKNVRVSDMSGRVVRLLTNVSNSASIEGLENGVYSIQVTDLSSAAVAVEKVIIKKR